MTVLPHLVVFLLWGGTPVPQPTPSSASAAAKQGDISAIRALIKQHADINTPSPDGMTALDWAARSNDLEMARLLIDTGANVKYANRYGVTSLSLAATNGSAPMI